MIKKILFYTILLFLTSQQLYGQKVYDTSEAIERYLKRRQLPRDKYKFSKAKHQENLDLAVAIADTDAVYISSYYSYYNKKTIYNFIRFFGSGEVYESLGYFHYPEEKDFNDLYYGVWGLYKYNQKTKGIIVELPSFESLSGKSHLNFLAHPEGLIANYGIYKGKGIVDKRTYPKLWNYKVEWE